MLNFLRRYWFPLALVGLVLLAIPGIVLFILNFTGYDGTVNAWLRDTFNLTYHLPIPLWGGIVLLLMPLAVVLLYFLKLKRKALQVPSTFLWRKSIEDLHVNSLLQWLRQNVLLLLQLLTLLFFFLAVLAFRFYGAGGDGKRYILLIDNSASMSATDIGMSRLEWAKQEALKEIDAAGDNDSGMVIEFSSNANPKQSFTSNKDVLRQAVRSIQQTQRTTQIDNALKLASSLANPPRTTEDMAVRPPDPEPGKERTYAAVEGIPTIPTEVHLFSDGRFADVTDFQAGTLKLRFHSAGMPGADKVDNVALVGLRATRDDDNPGKLRVFVRVLNYRDQPLEAKVQVTVQPTGKEDKSIYERVLKLEARVVQQEKDGDRVTVRDLPGEGSASIDIEDPIDAIVHAKLVDVKDQFPLDDEAWLALGVIRKARVLIVGKANEVLDRFFDNNQAVKDVAIVTKMTPEVLAGEAYLKPARNGDYDLIVFDRCAPRKLEEMPRSNTFFIGAVPPGTLAAAPKKSENPPVLDWRAQHPLLRYLVSLQDIGIAEAILVTKQDLPDRTPILIESNRETALLFAVSRQSFTDLVMTFPLLNDEGKWNTDWPLKPGFPLFLTNVLRGLGYIKDAVEEEPTRPGDLKVIRPDVAVESIEVVGPRVKKTLEREQRADFSFADTDRIGVYRVAWNGQVQRSFAVNLLDPEESNLEPRTEIQLGAERIIAGEARGQPRDLWPIVLLGAILLLLLEWYIYNRRVYI